MENETIKISDIALPEFNHQYEDVKSCPNCSSVFINAKGCDSCNYQFGFDKLGEVLGKKSFYTIRESYWSSMTFFAKTYPFIEKKGLKYQTYKRACMHRFEVLLLFFSNENSHLNESYNVYFKELKDLIKELSDLDIREEYIWKKVDMSDFSSGKGSSTNLYQQISLSIEEGRLGQSLKKQSLFQQIMEYRIVGTLRFGVLLLFLVTSIIACLLAISLYQYALLVS